MATNFPGSQDSFTNPTSGSSLSSPSHSEQHADANDAIEAIEGALLDGAPLHIDDANERIGVGTSSPQDVLHVVGDVTIEFDDDGSAAQPELTLHRESATPADGDYLGQLKFAGKNDVGQDVNYAKITGKISDVTDGTEDGLIEIANITAGSQSIGYRFTSTDLKLLNGRGLQVDGNVGIGTTSPQADLHIASGTTDLYLQDTDGTVGGSMSARIRITDSAGNIQGTIGSSGTASGVMLMDNHDGPLLLRTLSEDDLNLVTNSLTRMSVKSDGNVGIGTTAPQYALHVNAGTGNTGLLIQSTDSVARANFSDIDTTGTNYVGIGAVGDDLRFFAGNATRMSVASSGNVGIGTNSPNRLLDLNATTNSYLGWSEGGTEAWVAGYEGGANNRFIIWGGTPGGTKAYRIVVLDDGKVGINNATPSHTLDVNGTGRFTSTLQYDSVIHGNGLQSRDKIRVWNSSYYTIGMKSGYTYGHLNNDYAMSFQMNNDIDRGFWWGDDVHTDAQGAMSLTTNGRLTVATSLSVGQGESVTAPSTKALYVGGDAQATGNIEAQGNMYIGKNGGGDSILYFYDDNSNAWREFFWDDSENRFRTSHNMKLSGYLHAATELYTGENGGGDSWVHYYDDNSNTWRSLGWDDSVNDWRAEDNGGTFRVLYHSGNVNKDGVDWTCEVLRMNECRGDSGSNTDPSYTFQDDQDTGFYRKGSGQIGVTCNSANATTFYDYGISSEEVIGTEYVRSIGQVRSDGTFNTTTASTTQMVHIGSSSYSYRMYRSTSRRDAKTDIETIGDAEALALLDSRPVWFRSALPADDPTLSYYGFIAEELAEVDPRLCTWDAGRILGEGEELLEGERACICQNNQDFVHTFDHEPECLQVTGVDYGRLTAHLTRIAQLQDSTIKDLTTRIEVLETA